MAEDKDPVWVSTPTPNLVKYAPAGTYYLRARFGGNPIRELLKTPQGAPTTSYAVAKVLLRDRLDELRKHNPGRRAELKTFPDLLRVLRKEVDNDPGLKRASKRAYHDWIDDMEPGEGAAVPDVLLSRLNRADLEEWWARTAKRYQPSRANSLFMMMKRAITTARGAGAISRDLMKGMERLDIPRTRLTLCTIEQLQVLLASIRATNSQAADWVEFMAYSGLRPCEIENLLWEHLDDARSVIEVHGGEEGTKNRRVRFVPMVPAMVELVARMRGPTLRVGKVFTILRPKTVFKRALAKLGICDMRIYDLRHLFATVCTQNGLDMATLAKWLGHSDGGSLALKTYVHPTSDHERQAAAKVRF